MVESSETWWGDSRRAQLCGHRGHSIGHLENCAESLMLASQFGADWCEIDVQVTCDGELAAFHDLILDDASTGRGPLWTHPSDYVFDQDVMSRVDGGRVGRIEPLAPLLDLSKSSGLRLILEPKALDLDASSDMLRAMLGAVEACGMSDRIIMSSFDFQFLKRAKSKAPIRTCGIVKQRFVDLQSLCEAADLDVVLVDFPYIDEDAFARLVEAGSKVAYFVPSPRMFDCLGECGARHLDRLRNAIDRGLISMLGCDDVRWGRAFLGA